MQNKREIISEMLEKGLVTVSVKTQTPGIILPSYLVQQGSCRLNLSWNFGANLELKDDGIHADLSFNGTWTRCLLPWESIWIADQGENHFLFIGEAVLKIRPAQPPPSLRTSKLYGKKADMVILDELVEETKLRTVEGGYEITPPRQGHLRLVN